MPPAPDSPRSRRRPADPVIARPRLVLDTNVFMAAAYKPDSACRRLLTAVESGLAILLVSRAVFDEYRHILSRGIRTAERGRLIRRGIAAGVVVRPGPVARLVPDDPSDDKFLALAIAGRADAIVTADQHLFAAADRIVVPILRPTDAVQRFGL